jgi:DNA primase
MRIPDETIEQVRSASDIVELISASVALRKRGKNYTGLCPFHQEKTPSFTVSAEKQMYHCFGCGAGGNVFTYVMETEKVSFVEAVRTLAEKAGIPLPTESREDRLQETENEGLYEACRLAGLFFHENLTTTTEGKLALEYLHHRGFQDETIRKFGLGYSMNAWDSMVKFAEGRHLDVGTLEKAGLIARREDGTGYYDRFRGRVMFPIFSVSGRTIGFGARKLREDDPLGKYLNSPETPIYNKSRVLYGLSYAKEAIREKEFAILVEGYADLLSVFQAGIENVVASSGTALTEGQIQLVGRYAKSITLVYDADSAGSKATLRGVDLVLEGGFDVKVAELPPGEDPDSFVRKNGRKGFEDLLGSAVSFLDFKARVFKEEGLLDTPEGRTKAVRSIVMTIARMPDELKRNIFVKSISERYDIYESVLFRELERVIAQEKGRVRFDAPKGTDTTALPGEKDRLQSTAGAGEIPAAERDLLKVILENGPEMANGVLSEIGPAAFRHPLARALVDVIQRLQGQEWDIHSLLASTERPDIRRFVATVVFGKYEISKSWSVIRTEPTEADPALVAERAIAMLRLRDLEEQIHEQFRQLKAAEGRGESLTQYQQRIMQLQHEKKELQKRR